MQNTARPTLNLLTLSLLAAGVACGGEDEAQCGSDMDCPEGQRCDLSGGLCFEPCTEVGSSVGCTGQDVCLNDGTCATPCDDAECVTSGELCQSDVEDTGFNTCVNPDFVASSCPNDDGFTRDQNGPLLLGNVEFVGEVGMSMSCAGGAMVTEYEAIVYAPNGLPEALYTEGLEFIDPSGDVSFVFSEGPSSPYHPSAEQLVGSEFIEVDFTLCEAEQTPMSDFAIRIFNQDGDASNAVCF
jgi:Cys-rich repeat protein